MKRPDLDRLLPEVMQRAAQPGVDPPAALRELICSAAPEEVRLDLLGDHLDPGEEEDEE